MNFSVERFMWYMAALKGMTKDERSNRSQRSYGLWGSTMDVLWRKIGAQSDGMK